MSKQIKRLNIFRIFNPSVFTAAEKDASQKIRAAHQMISRTSSIHSLVSAFLFFVIFMLPETGGGRLAAAEEKGAGRRNTALAEFESHYLERKKDFKAASQSRPGSRQYQTYLQDLELLKQEAARLQRLLETRQMGADLDFVALTGALIFAYKNKSVNMNFEKQKTIETQTDPAVLTELIDYNLKALKKVGFDRDGKGALDPAFRNLEPLLELQRLCDYYEARVAKFKNLNKNYSARLYFEKRLALMRDSALRVQNRLQRENPKTAAKIFLPGEVDVLIQNYVRLSGSKYEMRLKIEDFGRDLSDDKAVLEDTRFALGRIKKVIDFYLENGKNQASLREIAPETAPLDIPDPQTPLRPELSASGDNGAASSDDPFAALSTMKDPELSASLEAQRRTLFSAAFARQEKGGTETAVDFKHFSVYRSLLPPEMRERLDSVRAKAIRSGKTAEKANAEALTELEDRMRREKTASRLNRKQMLEIIETYRKEQ